MWNGSKTRLWTTLLPRATPLYLTFFLYHLTSTVGGSSPSSYTAVDNILLNCGSSGNSTALDGRTWIGDLNSKFSPLEQSQNQAISLTASTVQQSPYAVQVPYATARISLSAFTYIFPVTSGQKFIRLYFYPASYPNFDRSKALFSVKVGRFTLLNNFNASLTADADDDPGDTIFREYCVNIEEDQRLNITFTPSVSNSYAFVSGIEILSMPSNLYYPPSDNEGVFFIGQRNLYHIDNDTALEMVYRVNVGGRSISPAEDTGMFRGWNQDDKYLTQYEELVLPFNDTIELKFTQVPAYTAPEEVYQTARTMGTNKTINKSYKLTWEFPVDSGFYYLIRLHFCEFQPEIIQQHDREFLIFIANQTAEEAADVIKWSGGNGVPVYREYVAAMFGEEGVKKMKVCIALQANPQDWKTSYSDAILNGVEIFKVSAFNGNLAGPNPDPLPLTPRTVMPPTPPMKSKNNRITIVVIVGGVSSFVVLSIIGFLILRRRQSASDGTTWWGPSSFSMTKSMKTHTLSLPSAFCVVTSHYLRLDLDQSPTTLMNES